jgi:hypothetical protein
LTKRGMAAGAAKLAEEMERERKREAIRARITAVRAGKAEGEVGGQAGGGQEASGASENVRSTAEEEEKERKRCASSFSLLQQIVSSDSCLPFVPPAFKPTCAQVVPVDSVQLSRWSLAPSDDQELLALSTEVIGIVNLGRPLPKFAMMTSWASGFEL